MSLNLPICHACNTTLSRKQRTTITENVTNPPYMYLGTQLKKCDQMHSQQNIVRVVPHETITSNFNREVNYRECARRAEAWKAFVMHQVWDKGRLWVLLSMLERYRAPRYIAILENGNWWYLTIYWAAWKHIYRQLKPECIAYVSQHFGNF